TLGLVERGHVAFRRLHDPSLQPHDKRSALLGLFITATGHGRTQQQHAEETKNKAHSSPETLRDALNATSRLRRIDYPTITACMQRTLRRLLPIPPTCSPGAIPTLIAGAPRHSCFSPRISPAPSTKPCPASRWTRPRSRAHSRRSTPWSSTISTSRPHPPRSTASASY